MNAFMRSSLFVAVMLVSACKSATDTGSNTNVLGTWRYTATQTLPALSLTGTLRFTDQNGSQYSGRLEFEEVDAQGIKHARAGSASGRVVNQTSLDFDVILDAIPRRHVGRIQADTITGTWVEVQGTSALSGTFRAVRTGGA